MGLEIDHVFIWTAPGAPEADAVLAAGLVEGSPNRHEGQGTANRRVFFQDSMLEFLWVEHEDEARGAPAEKLLLWDRWSRRGSGACPFGICFRGTEEKPPFTSWLYAPPYSPSGIHIAIDSSDPEQPLLFYFSVPAKWSRPGSEPRYHPAGMRKLTDVRLSGPSSSRLSAIKALADYGSRVLVRESPTFLLELAFDGEPRGLLHDARPSLPLRLSW